MNKIEKIYTLLLNLHGAQGWWPLSNHIGENPTKSGSTKGYHPNNYSLPLSENEKFEICVGAILTQNTNWQNVEKAITNILNQKLLTCEKIINAKPELLKEMIRPSGYYNQKAKKIIKFCNFFKLLKGDTPKREELLNIWGIGPETADSILLYAYKVPTFIIDAYTKRIFTHLKIIDNKKNYNWVKTLFEDHLNADYRIYNEYHALIVEHAKHYYSKKPYGKNCPLVQYFM